MTKIIKADNSIVKSEDYTNLLHELRGLIDKGKIQAYKAVDNILVETRWQMGERIVREELNNKDRADYSTFLIDSLASDLKIRKRELYEIIKFYRTYPIVRTVSAQLSWSHYLALVEIENEKERLFYQNRAIIHSWSVREAARDK